MRNVGRSEAGIFFEDVPSHLRRRTADVQLIENGQRLTSKRHTENTPADYYQRFVSDTVDSSKYVYTGRLFTALRRYTALYILTCPESRL